MRLGNTFLNRMMGSASCGFESNASRTVSDERSRRLADDAREVQKQQFRALGARERRVDIELDQQLVRRRTNSRMILEIIREGLQFGGEIVVPTAPTAPTAEVLQL